MTTTAQLGFDFAAKPKKAKAPRVKMTPEERAQRAAEKRERKMRELCCATCGLSWHDGCERPDWIWIDVGFIGMASCARCDRQVCHHCYARYEYYVLCPACWDLPEPARAEAMRFFGDDYADEDDAWALFWRGLDWRFTMAEGQFLHIAPPEVWFWQQRAAAWRDLPEKVSDARYSVCTGHKKPKPADALWMPEWMPGWLAARDEAAAAVALDDL